MCYIVIKSDVLDPKSVALALRLTIDLLPMISVFLYMSGNRFHHVCIILCTHYACQIIVQTNSTVGMSQSHKVEASRIVKAQAKFKA